MIIKNLYVSYRKRLTIRPRVRYSAVMDKQAALSKAAEYEAEAKRGLPAAIILSDFTNYERSMEEARTYRWLATLHPATRRAWIISNWGGK